MNTSARTTIPAAAGTNPVREAARRLEAEGLPVAVDSRGLWIAQDIHHDGRRYRTVWVTVVDALDIAERIGSAFGPVADDEDLGGMAAYVMSSEEDTEYDHAAARLAFVLVERAACRLCGEEGHSTDGDGAVECPNR